MLGYSADCSKHMCYYFTKLIVILFLLWFKQYILYFVQALNVESITKYSKIKHNIIYEQFWTMYLLKFIENKNMIILFIVKWKKKWLISNTIYKIVNCVLVLLKYLM